MNKRILIANDHGGYVLKTQFCKWLNENGYEAVDFGCFGEDIVRYPFYAAKVASAVGRGEAERGVLICSTGIGMSIVANKFPGVRAALCSDTYMAKMTRLHNNSNILCIGGKTTGVYTAIDILDTWLNTEYMGERHDISLGLICDLESVQIVRGDWTGAGHEDYPRA